MYYFQAGGSFMWPQIIVTLILIGLALKKVIDLFQRTDQSAEALRKGIATILQLGIFCFFWGVLAQAIGLYQMLAAIEGAGDISPALLAGGLKVSMISLLFGLIILVVSMIVWFGLRLRYQGLVEEVAA